MIDSWFALYMFCALATALMLWTAVKDEASWETIMFCALLWPLFFLALLTYRIWRVLV